MRPSSTSRPVLTLVVATTDDGVIGLKGALPWRLPEDLKRFKAATLGKPILMGRKTFESIGRALPGRHNIVLTRARDYRPTDPTISVVHDLEAALVVAGEVADVMVIGGGDVYALALPQAQRVLRTRVHAKLMGDAYFPALSADDWQLVASEEFPADANHSYAMTFETLKRRPAR